MHLERTHRRDDHRGGGLVEPGQAECGGEFTQMSAGVRVGYRERDIDHVMHALKFLKPEGCLIAIMSAGTEFRETRKSIAFRELMDKMGAKWRDLPAGSFASVGTYCNTIMLRVWKDGRQQRYW